jgi:hypothetical protein
VYDGVAYECAANTCLGYTCTNSICVETIKTGCDNNNPAQAAYTYTMSEPCPDNYTCPEWTYCNQDQNVRQIINVRLQFV